MFTSSCLTEMVGSVWSKDDRDDTADTVEYDIPDGAGCAEIWERMEEERNE